MRIFKRFLFLFTSILGVIIIFNTIEIYRYSLKYSDEKSDVAIVLGAASYSGRLSPVYRERVNHGISLLNEGKVEYLIFTGGFGEDESISDSRSAKNYAMIVGVDRSRILIEDSSTITYENLVNAKKIMAENGLKTALIVSDPLHMKRSMSLCKSLDIKAKSSPTPTSMYKSRKEKFKSLCYESFFYNLNLFLFRY